MKYYFIALQELFFVIIIIFYDTVNRYKVSPFPLLPPSTIFLFYNFPHIITVVYPFSNNYKYNFLLPNCMIMF